MVRKEERRRELAKQMIELIKQKLRSQGGSGTVTIWRWHADYGDLGTLADFIQEHIDFHLIAALPPVGASTEAACSSSMGRQQRPPPASRRGASSCEALLVRRMMANALDGRWAEQVFFIGQRVLCRDKDDRAQKVGGRGYCGERKLWRHGILRQLNPLTVEADGFGCTYGGCQWYEVINSLHGVQLTDEAAGWVAMFDEQWATYYYLQMGTRNVQWWMPGVPKLGVQLSRREVKSQHQGL